MARLKHMITVRVVWIIAELLRFNNTLQIFSLWSIESSSQSSILENELQGTALHTVTDFRKVVTHIQQIPRLCNYSLSPQYHTSLPAASNATLTNAPKTFLFWSPRLGRRLVDRDVGQEIAGFDRKTIMAIQKGSREEAVRIT